MTHRILKAFFADTMTGTVTTLRLPDETLLPGEVHYNESVHGARAREAANRKSFRAHQDKTINPQRRYQLLCGGCDLSRSPGAEIHYHPDIPIRIGGMAKATRHHWHTNSTDPVQQHLHCKYNEAAKGKARDYSKAAGYSINLNIPSVDDDLRAPSLVHNDEAGRLVYHDLTIANLEPVSIHSVADLVDFIERCPPEKFQHSYVVHKGYPPIPWAEFCINKGRAAEGPEPVAGKRFVKLVETLIEHGGRVALPVLMEVSFIKPITAHNGFNTARGASRSMFWGKTEDEVWMGRNLMTFEKSHHIQPRVTLNNMRDPAIAGAVPEKGSYLVLGHARLERQDMGTYTNYYVEVKVDRADQIMACDISEITYRPKPEKAAQNKVQSSENHPAP